MGNKTAQSQSYGSETPPTPRIFHAQPTSAQRTHNPWQRACICLKTEAARQSLPELPTHPPTLPDQWWRKTFQIGGAGVARQYGCEAAETCEAREKICTTLRRVLRSVLVVLWAMYSKHW